MELVRDRWLLCVNMLAVWMRWKNKKFKTRHLNIAMREDIEFVDSFVYGAGEVSIHQW